MLLNLFIDESAAVITAILMTFNDVETFKATKYLKK
jgi:hypothetical protein